MFHPHSYQVRTSGKGMQICKFRNPKNRQGDHNCTGFIISQPTLQEPKKPLYDLKIGIRLTLKKQKINYKSEKFQ